LLRRELTEGDGDKTGKHIKAILPQPTTRQQIKGIELVLKKTGLKEYLWSLASTLMVESAIYKQAETKLVEVRSMAFMQVRRKPKRVEIAPGC
jgi:hypothetical protein